MVLKVQRGQVVGACVWARDNLKFSALSAAVSGGDARRFTIKWHLHVCFVLLDHDWAFWRFLETSCAHREANVNGVIKAAVDPAAGNATDRLLLTWSKHWIIYGRGSFMRGHWVIFCNDADVPSEQTKHCSSSQSTQQFTKTTRRNLNHLRICFLTTIISQKILA